MTISIKNLSLNFQNKKILKNVSFEIKKNTLTSLLGPNGSGKSSILKCITGEIDTYSGKITNIPIEKIAYLPQELETPPFITVKELVSLGFYNRKISKINKDKIIEKLIHDCGIDSIKKQLFENISSGEKQRTWIAFILAQSKNIILMDEPFSSIDTNSKTEFYKLFKNLADKGNTIILISHDIKIISEFSEQAIFIQNGVKIFDGDAKEIQLAIKNSEII